MTWTPSDAYSVIARHYLLFSFGVCVGALQVAASISGLRGMSFLPWATANRLLGAAIMAVSVLLFFLAPLWVEGPWAAGSVDADSATRQWGTASWNELAGAYNVNDIHGGVSGTAQAIWFPTGSVLALAVCLTAGAVRIRLSRRRPANGPGQQRRASSHGDKSAGAPPRPRLDSAVEPRDGLAGLTSEGYDTVLPVSLALLRCELRDELRREFDPARHPLGIPARLARMGRRG